MEIASESEAHNASLCENLAIKVLGSSVAAAGKLLLIILSITAFKVAAYTKKKLFMMCCKVLSLSAILKIGKLQ